jgi:hypothetical protein
MEGKKVRLGKDGGPNFNHSRLSAGLATTHVATNNVRSRAPRTPQVTRTDTLVLLAWELA